ncbi:MAG: hypothetical protein KKB21_04930, partial [Nanoarchaeota archaeon]|nr:hypothetical protein [Nanoarchaeota archaeon]
NGIICGMFNISREGEYGFLHVYGDDSITTLDEGAKRGDIIIFYINDKQLKGNASWKGGRETTMLNLSIVAGDNEIKQCQKGVCCDIKNKKFKAQGNQPTGFVDDANGLCSSYVDSEVKCTGKGTCYILTKDYYCNGNDVDIHVSYALQDTCEGCSYCANNKLKCKKYSSSTKCSLLLDCDYLNNYYIEGAQSSTTTSYCRYRDYKDNYKYCDGFGFCSSLNCKYSESTKATAGICKYIGGCSGNIPGAVKNYLKGTSCGTGKVCNGNGKCVKL